jgi:putative molybdopterin biosynthesis protein
MELTRKAPSRLGVEEFVRLAVGRVGPKLMATPLGRGAGNITTLTRAQAVMRIPPESEGVAEGATIQGELLCAPEELDRILVCVGSHDNVLDLLADELMGLDSPFRLVSTHVGSMGGITAIRNGACHLSGMHLFDEGTGDFNFPDLAKFLPGVEVAVINLAIRHQGLIVQKGNPLNIRGVKDLGRKDLRFINRQRGAGTRILLDWHLKEAGMKASAVAGYDKEESTHMAVAVNVLTGAAQCGMGIFAAAHALDLGFVPLARERYDRVIPVKFLHDPRIEAVLGLMRSRDFQARIEALGGYETHLTGQRMKPGMGLG